LSIRPHMKGLASMTGKGVLVAVLLAFVAFALLSLLGGAHYLETPLPGGLPFGNLLTALGLCATAGASLALSLPGTRRRTLAATSLAAAVAWLPVSVLLAGNPQLNFGDERGHVWLAFSVAVVVGACSTLGWGLGASVLAKFRSADAA